MPKRKKIEKFDWETYNDKWSKMQYQGSIVINLSIGPEMYCKEYGQEVLEHTGGPLFIKLPLEDLENENYNLSIQETNNIWNVIEEALRTKYGDRLETICEH
jgi:hypothetical protein